MSPPAKRDDLLDTRRGALALAVVLGHVLAMLPGAGAVAWALSSRYALRAVAGLTAPAGERR